MPPLFATKLGSNSVSTLTVGSVTMAWGDWAFLLNAILVALTLLSVLLAIHFGRWWITLPIALITAFVCITGSDDPQDDFWESWYGFVLVLPLVIVHAVLSSTIPKRKQPLDDWPDAWEPTSRFDPHQDR